MNKYIINAVEYSYGFNPVNANKEELDSVEEIMVSNVATYSDNSLEWDFSAFPKLKRLDCSYNRMKRLIVTNNKDLEEIYFESTMYDFDTIDLSNNKHLKKFKEGQNGFIYLDFSTNSEIDEINIHYNRYLRWLNLDSCKNLKRITLTGVNIPFVDLTSCSNLEYVDINYWNIYAGKYDEYGPDVPRPIIFVAPSFDENIIPQDRRDAKDVTYYIVKTGHGSYQEEILHKLKMQKDYLINILSDRGGIKIAKLHYEIRALLEDSMDI